MARPIRITRGPPTARQNPSPRCPEKITTGEAGVGTPVLRRSTLHMTWMMAMVGPGPEKNSTGNVSKGVYPHFFGTRKGTAFFGLGHGAARWLNTSKTRSSVTASRPRCLDCMPDHFFFLIRGIRLNYSAEEGGLSVTLFLSATHEGTPHSIQKIRALFCFSVYLLWSSDYSYL